MIGNDDVQPARVLEGVVGLQDVIRAISASVRQVNLVALNAIVLTESQQEGGRGFALVAQEMRALSGRLESEMSTLLSTSVAAVRTAAQLLSATRRRRLLATCIRLAPQAAARLDVEGPVRAARARVREAQAEVRKCLVETTKLGLMLTVVARFARLEAAYGDGIAEQLAVVSDDFARASANISGSLVSLSEHQKKLEAFG